MPVFDINLLKKYPLHCVYEKINNIMFCGFFSHVLSICLKIFHQNQKLIRPFEGTFDEEKFLFETFSYHYRKTSAKVGDGDFEVLFGGVFCQVSCNQVEPEKSCFILTEFSPRRRDIIADFVRDSRTRERTPISNFGQHMYE